MIVREISGVKTERDTELVIVDATGAEPISLVITRADRAGASVYLEVDEVLMLADQLKAAAVRAVNIS